MTLTKLLLEKGLLTLGQLKEAAALQQAEELRLDRAIVQLGFLSERQSLCCWQRIGYPDGQFGDISFDPETL